VALPPRGDVEATLQYLVDDGVPPFNYMYRRDDGGEQSHGRFETRSVIVHDARPFQGSLSLDKCGFLLLPHMTSLLTSDFYQRVDKIWGDYYREIADLVKLATGCSKVVVFDHNVRNPREMQFRRGVIGYVPYAHNDYTVESAPLRVADVAKEGKLDEYSGKHYMIINVWRNISEAPVAMDPFAVCDGVTVPMDDFIPHDLFYKERKGQTYSVRHSAAHRWMYFSGMRHTEAMLLKCYDTRDAPGLVRWTAHSGFIDPRAPSDAPVRESIDARCLAFFDEGDELRTALTADDLFPFLQRGAQTHTP